MGVTWPSEAGWGAKPADVPLEGLEGTAQVTGRLLEGGARGPTAGGELRELNTGQSTHMGLGHCVLEVLVTAGKAQLASVKPLTQLVGREPPPSPPIRGQCLPRFTLGGRRDSAAAAGMEQPGAGLLRAHARPDAEQGAGLEGSGASAHRSALPDPHPGQEAEASKVHGAGGEDRAQVPGRGCDREEVAPGELGSPRDRGGTETAPPPGDRTARGPGESCSARCALRPGAGATAGSTTVRAAGPGKALEGHLEPHLETPSTSPRRARSMRWRAAFFSPSRSSAVTRKPSSGAGGSRTGPPGLCGSRGILRLRGLEQSDVGERSLQGSFCPVVAPASCWRWFFIWQGTGGAAGHEGLSWLTFSGGLGGSRPCLLAGPLLLCTDGNSLVEL